MALLERLTILLMPPAFKAGGFDCGEPEVDEYICDGDAATDEAAAVTRTYLVVDGDRLVGSGDNLVGYVSVMCDAIRLTKEERPTPYGGAPALKIGRMGVRKEYRGQQVGPWILDRIVGLARNLAKQAGLRYVTLDALPKATLVQWYGRNGFKKNLAEEHFRRVIKRSGSRQLKKKKVEEIELTNVSMRLDILLQQEAAQATIERPSKA